MDGGGRVAGSLNAGSPAADARTQAVASHLPRSIRRFVRSRRSRPFAAIETRLAPMFGTSLVALSLAVVAGAGFVASGRYDAFIADNGGPLDILARVAGFGVEKVTISGISRMYEREVLAAAGIDWRTSVPFLDVTEVRAKLVAVPLIESASVRKVYPNEIVITQVEREPAALWQMNGEIKVIAADGTVVDEMKDERYANLPLVVGENANGHLHEYLGLIAAAGPLGERIKAGTYVSGRRWTLKLDGVDIRLPEADPAEALARLVDLERKNRLLEKDVIAIDLRLPDRVVLRLTEEAAAARTEAQKKLKKGAAT